MYNYGQTVINFDSGRVTIKQGYTRYFCLRQWRRCTQLQRLLLICLFLSLVMSGVFILSLFLDVSKHEVDDVRDYSTQKSFMLSHAHKMSVSKQSNINGMFPKVTSFLSNKHVLNENQVQIVEAFNHSWKAYKLYAWGQDEVHPLTKSYGTWMGAALTMVDSLDTMLIMGLKQEFNESRDWLHAHLKLNLDKDHVNVFETTIRLLGGFLSTYHLSGDPMFLHFADTLGGRLLGAFDSQSGLPFSDINLATGKGQSPVWTIESSTAEATTIQLEFRELSRLTGKQIYASKVDRVTSILHNLEKRDGLVPIFINPQSGQFRTSSAISLGARGDSYYEYLLKQWVQLRRRPKLLKSDYLIAVDGIRKHLTKRSGPRGLLFVGELSSASNWGPFYAKMDHLVCFLPGTLAYGYVHGMPREHLDFAKELMATCWQMYAQTATGLAPEIAHFELKSGDSGPDILIKPLDKHNLLRPETVESLFYLWRVTKDARYREWGWAIFRAFQRYCRLPRAGFVSISDVTNSARVGQRTKTESFWFSETLKYFFLLFSDDEKLFPLSDWVFNTEAHPLPVFSKHASSQASLDSL